MGTAAIEEKLRLREHLKVGTGNIFHIYLLLKVCYTP
jgi:hypothetical protein